MACGDEREREREREGDPVITKLHNRIPKLTDEAVCALVDALEPADSPVPEWLVTLVQVAYQNGRYDEACSETVEAFL